MITISGMKELKLESQICFLTDNWSAGILFKSLPKPQTLQIILKGLPWDMRLRPLVYILTPYESCLQVFPFWTKPQKSAISD